MGLPLRLRDLAELEVLALSAWDDPLAALPTEDAPDDPTFRKALRDACDALEYHRPLWGSDACLSAAMFSGAGQLTILGSVLRTHKPTVEQLDGFVPLDDTEERTKLFSVAFGVDPLASLVGRINRVIGAPTIKPKGIPWHEAVCKLAIDTGIEPATMAEWTIPEFNLIAAGGKLDPWGVPKSTDNEWPEYKFKVAPLQRAFFGEGKESRKKTAASLGGTVHVLAAGQFERFSNLTIEVGTDRPLAVERHGPPI